MNVREMKIFARSIIRDAQMLDSHFLRWINLAHRQFSRQYIIPMLKNGDQVSLVAVTGSTQKYYLPYDFSAVVAFVDSNGRSLDPIPSEDVRQYGEYNTFGSFVAFYEYLNANVTPLADSGSTPVLIGIPNRSVTVTATGGTPFTSAMVGEWILPLDRNTTSGSSNPEDYGYRISAFTSITVVTIERPFRGAISDAGSVGDVSTSYFEVRPRNTPIVRIWGDPGASATLYLEYQRKPSKLANDEDIPEDERLSEAIVLKAIELAGWAYKSGFHAQKAPTMIAEALGSYVTVKERDKLLIHNFLHENPNTRSYSQIGGQHIGASDRFSSGGIIY